MSLPASSTLRGVRKFSSLKRSGSTAPRRSAGPASLGGGSSSTKPSRPKPPSRDSKSSDAPRSYTAKTSERPGKPMKSSRPSFKSPASSTSSMPSRAPSPSPGLQPSNSKLPPIVRGANIRAMYYDKNLVVLNKPSGLISQPGNAYGHGLRSSSSPATDLDMAYTAIRRQLSLPSTQAFHPVHRLDRLTTGCLLLPTSSSFARDISNQISSRQVQKSYLALVRGGKQSFEKKSGVIDLGLHVDTHGRMRVGRPGGSVKGGEKETIMPARTNWEVIAHSDKYPLTLLRLHPHTGLKHQLRLHCAMGLQAPILGDDLYSRSRLSSSVAALKSLDKMQFKEREFMFLHASSITIQRFVKSRHDSIADVTQTDRETDEQSVTKAEAEPAETSATTPTMKAKAKRVQLTIAAPLPDIWKRLCDEVGISLGGGLSSSASSSAGTEPTTGAKTVLDVAEEVKGGIWVDGEKVDEVDGLFGKWVWR